MDYKPTFIQPSPEVYHCLDNQHQVEDALLILIGYLHILTQLGSVRLKELTGNNITESEIYWSVRRGGNIDYGMGIVEMREALEWSKYYQVSRSLTNSLSCRIFLSQGT